MAIDHLENYARGIGTVAEDFCVVSREKKLIDPQGLECLLADALAIVKNLEEGAGEPKPEQRDRMLELLFILANLHEYVAHLSIRMGRLA